MKNSLRTKIALISLVFVSSIAYAKKNNKPNANKAVFTLDGATQSAFAGTGTTAVTGIDAPARVKGNLFVDGRLYGQFFPVGTKLSDVKDARDLAYVTANGFADRKTHGGDDATDLPVTSPILIDDAVARELTAKNLKVDGNLVLGTKRFVGQFNDFNPASHNIILTFAHNDATGRPAQINWSYVTTTTWTGAALSRNEPVSVFVTNGGIPDLVSPLRPGRSFVSNSDMLYTNTVYVWTSKNNAGVGYRGTNTANAGGANFFNINRSRQGAYNATTNQDLTLTSSVRNITTGGCPLDSGATISSAAQMGWGLTAKGTSGTLAVTTANTGFQQTPTAALVGTSGANVYNPFGANGILYYEIIGDNVTDIALGFTWDRSATLVSVLSGFTTAQLNTLLQTLIALLGINARGPQPTSREAIIELLSKHGDLLKKTGVLSRMMNA